MISADTILPYLVTDAYPTPSVISYPSLGNGVRVGLVTDLGGMVRSVDPHEIDALGMTWEGASKRALTNLEMLLQKGAIQSTLFKEGPGKSPFILVGGHWAAASTILLPRLRTIAIESLNTNELCASMPHRGALLIFPKGDRSYRDSMRRMIREKESEAHKLLTFDLFQLTENGPKPLHEH